MSTLVDPLADLGTLLTYWSEETDDAVLAVARVMAPVTAAEGSRAAPRSCSATPRGPASTSPMSSGYQAFAYFKLAVVCQGSPRARRAARCWAPASTRRSELVAPLVAAGRRILGLA